MDNKVLEVVCNSKIGRLTLLLENRTNNFEITEKMYTSLV